MVSPKGNAAGHVMRWAYHYRKPFTRQLALCAAFQKGCKHYGHEVISVEGFSGPRSDVDGLILFGIGGVSREVFDSYLRAGKAALFVDKGYTDRAAMFRVAVNSFQPIEFVSHARKSRDRLDRMGIELKPYEPRPDGYVLFDGASNKFCLWQGLGDWQQWGERTRRELQLHTKRPIKYRPRPSHNIRETLAPFAQDLAGAALVVSYGGNIGYDAVVAGVPHFALGDSVARPLSETDLRKLDQLRIPSDGDRLQWLSNLAHCQYSLDEIASGAVWPHVTEQL